MKTLSRGILLIATTHPYYGRMAANLAMTIKAVEPEMQIAVIADEPGLSHLNETERQLFDSIIPAPKVAPGIKGAYSIRMRLPKLSPFNETLALDVDMLWLPKRKPSELFDLLADRDLTSINEGYHDLDEGKDDTTGLLIYWAGLDEVKAAYPVTGKLWLFRGEFLLFRSTEPVKAMFAEAAKIFKSPKVNIEAIGGGPNEEFAWSVAANLSKIDLHQPKWNPAYWPALAGYIVPPVHQMSDQYYALSFGGNRSPADLQRAYAIIAGAAAAKLGLRYRFPLQSKRNYLTERTKL